MTAAATSRALHLPLTVLIPFRCSIGGPTLMARPAGDRPYVGGAFTTANRKPRGNFVILDAAGNLVE